MPQPLTKPATRAHYEALVAAANAETITTKTRPAAVEFAVQRLLGDVDTFADELGAICLQRDDIRAEVDRALRMPGRLAEADDAVVLGAALSLADVGDFVSCGEAVALLVRRYIERSDKRLGAMVDEAMAS